MFCGKQQTVARKTVLTNFAWMQMWPGMQVMVGHLMKPEKMSVVRHLLYQLVTTPD